MSTELWALDFLESIYENALVIALHEVVLKVEQPFEIVVEYMGTDKKFPASMAFLFIRRGDRLWNTKVFTWDGYSM